MNTTVIVTVAVLALALIIFVILKNKRDRKKIFPTEDPVQEEMQDMQRRKDEM